jgi:hypothetical protein
LGRPFFFLTAVSGFPCFGLMDFAM